MNHREKWHKAQLQLNDFIVKLDNYVKNNFKLNGSITKDTNSNSCQIEWSSNGNTLAVSSENAELSIFTDRTHWHNSDFAPDDDLSEVFRKTENDIQEILSGKITSIAIYNNDCAIGGGSFCNDKTSVVDYINEHWPNWDYAEYSTWSRQIETIHNESK